MCAKVAVNIGNTLEINGGIISTQNYANRGNAPLDHTGS